MTQATQSLQPMFLIFCVGGLCGAIVWEIITEIWEKTFGKPRDRSLEMLKSIYEAEFGYGNWPTEKEIQKVISKAEKKVEK